MREGIHPKYQPVTVACACGNTFVTRSTASQIRLEICSACHPFYTGRQKLMDIAGRVERFEKRFASTGGKTVVRKPAKAVAPAKTKSPAKKGRVLSSAPTKTLKPKAKASEKPAAKAGAAK